MKIEYKRLTEKELSTFIDMRINQLREEGAKEEIDLRPALKEYYIRHMADGTFVSWLAFDGENIIGTSGMSFVEKPPYFGCPSGKLGLLSSMFTDPNYRRKVLQRNCYPVLWMMPENMVAERSRSQRPIWVSNYIQISDLFIMVILCNTNYSTTRTRYYAYI